VRTPANKVFRLDRVTFGSIRLRSREIKDFIAPLPHAELYCFGRQDDEDQHGRRPVRNDKQGKRAEQGHAEQAERQVPVTVASDNRTFQEPFAYASL
jgi:hypothetical protein